MLMNNNKKIISKLAINNMKKEKKKHTVLLITIALSVFMIYSILSVGFTYLDLSRLQDARLHGANFDAVIVNGFSDKQKNIVSKESKVDTVGVLSYAGVVKSSKSDATVDVALIWSDQSYWKYQHADVRTNEYGKYPQKENELMVTKKALEACNLASLNIGDTLSLTYETNTGVHHKDFIISGIWEGFGDQSVFYVSKEFYESTGYDLSLTGSLHMTFKSNYISNATIAKIEESLQLANQQLFQTTDYIDRSLTLLVGILGLCFIICVSAYLLIFNILYMSTIKKIRYYGLLQTLGMTKKQLIQLLRKQIVYISLLGMFLGVLLGFCISYFVVPYSMGILESEIGNISIQFHLVIVLLSLVVTSIAIILGMKNPLRIASRVTPIEAIKYQVSNMNDHGNKEYVKGKVLWKLAKQQLRKDKKTTLMILLSLATSLITFYMLVTIVTSQGKRTVFANYWDADFTMHNQSQTTEDIDSLQEVINDDFISKLKKLEGIEQIHSVEGVAILIPYQANGFSDSWIKRIVETRPYMNYEETRLEYQNNPRKYYGMLKAIDEEEFNYLNSLMGDEINKQEFISGNTSIIQYAGFEFTEEINGYDKVDFILDGQSHELPIGGVSYEGYYGATTNVGVSLIVSKDYLNSLTQNSYCMSLNIKYKEIYNEATEKSIQSLSEDNPLSQDVFNQSKYEDLKLINDAQGNMVIIGILISSLMLLISMLNYINTIVAGIHNRTLVFATMESIGMSRTQVSNLLIKEGLLYAIGSIFITFTIGTGITYIVFESMNYMQVSFSIPIVPVFIASLLVIVICVIIPPVFYKRLSAHKSLVERLKDFE